MYTDLFFSIILRFAGQAFPGGKLKQNIKGLISVYALNKNKWTLFIIHFFLDYLY